ncbi:hypothetical protein DCE79_14110 [Lysinibacillus sp. 2017]|uniref:hypothetical protein n=1 Tax=unclassified Lysinibacillus TaxID=2636778 RepID=UPI000D525A79|nr:MULTISPECIES: hypothetical protein [unclassified Lysinibacillus]AWE08431.1 hypothetical protein DCE79_14110 [Lysinibacillus sp. 2017]TGN34919.1 hypothetical protein E4L99_12110 [Lysinibacillus sp. S2017]
MDRFLLNFSGGFLYFPEDKSLYLPAAIEFAILIIIVFATFRFIRRLAARQADKVKLLEERALQERDERLAKEKQMESIQKQ